MISGGLRTKGITKQSQEGQPLITVVTVVRNGEKTLEETILSVINQTYKNIEYIIIDGASTDGTLDIIRKYEDKIDYWISEPDKGIYDAMNKGIDLATGEWINFMNSGDGFYDASILEKMIPNFNNTNIGVIYGNTRAVFDSGPNIIRAEDIYKMQRLLPFCHQSSFTRLMLLKEEHFNIKFKICADYNFFRKMYFSGINFEYIPLNITNFDSINGVSANNKIKLIIENYKINGMLSKKINIIFYCFDIVYALVSILLKSIVSKNIKRKIRNLKFEPIK